MVLAFVLTFLYILHAVADSISYSGMMISQRQRRIEIYLNRPQTAKRITISTAAEVVASIIGNGILVGFRFYFYKPAELIENPTALSMLCDLARVPLGSHRTGINLPHLNWCVAVSAFVRSDTDTRIMLTPL